MKEKRAVCMCAVLCFAGAGIWAEPRLTIYNQNFAVVRQTVPLDLAKGVSSLRFTDVTTHLEPSSVILRDPSGKRSILILEQSYRADPVSQELLLSLYEGKTIEFLVQSPGRPDVTVQGKILRSGYVPRMQNIPIYGQPYAGYSQGVATQPIIEVDGKLRFSLPGMPLFPALADDTVMKPEIAWQIEADQAGKLEAEMSYVTGGMRWQADYNILAAEEGNLLEIVGWVTFENQSGKTFENALVKLMAGEVNKIQPGLSDNLAFEPRSGFAGGGAPAPPVTERSFDEYHLYDLSRPVTLHDRETKQVEFIRAAGVKSESIYVYDGVKIDQDRYRGWNTQMVRQERDYGARSNPQVWTMREFANSDANYLGMPLPQGRVRFYRRDKDGRLEFTGENSIQHTPRDETIRVFTGSAFDLVGERRRTDYRIDSSRNMLDESFEITIRNHKKESAAVRIVEHLYRGTSWEITEMSNTFLKTDSQTIEFRIDLKPEEERKVTYTVHYTW